MDPSRGLYCLFGLDSLEIVHFILILFNLISIRFVPVHESSFDRQDKITVS